MKVSVHLRTGDWAIIAGVAVIAAYEKLVHDDDDLISRRVATYCRYAPGLTHAIVLLTALHLVEWIDPTVDPYAYLVRRVRHSHTPNASITITARGTTISRSS